MLKTTRCRKYEFNEKFVDGLIAQAASNVFAQVRIDAALATMSKYGFDFDDDLNPDHIKHDLGSILKIEKYENRSRFVVDEHRLIESQKSDKTSRRVGVMGLFGIKRSVDSARCSKDETNSLTPLTPRSTVSSASIL